jgi:PAS domain S-box-containing protein
LRQVSILEGALGYAESIVETIREPLLILGEDFRIVSANHAFYKTFRVSKQETEGQLLFELGGDQWDIPELRRLLGEILPHNEKFENFAVNHDFPGIGTKRMLLNARRIVQKESGGKRMILLAFEDMTEKK